MFKVQEKSRPETAIWLNKDEILLSNQDLGSAELGFETESDELCKAKIQLYDDNVYLADLSFNYPITLNNKAIAAGSKVKLQHNDTFSLGLTHFELINPRQIFSGITNKETSAHKVKSPPSEPKSNSISAINKRWITKPTSIGNRTNDSLDVILAQHQKRRRQLNLITLTALGIGITALYFLM